MLPDMPLRLYPWRKPISVAEAEVQPHICRCMSGIICMTTTSRCRQANRWTAHGWRRGKGVMLHRAVLLQIIRICRGLIAGRRRIARRFALLNPQSTPQCAFAPCASARRADGLPDDRGSVWLP